MCFNKPFWILNFENIFKIVLFRWCQFHNNLLTYFFISIVTAESLVPDDYLSYTPFNLIWIYWSHKQVICSSFISGDTHVLGQSKTDYTRVYAIQGNVMQQSPWMVYTKQINPLWNRININSCMAQVIKTHFHQIVLVLFLIGTGLAEFCFLWNNEVFDVWHRRDTHWS